MFEDLIISGSFELIKVLKKLVLDLFFTKSQLKHIIVFVLSMVLKGYNGKVSDVEELTSYRHRTSIADFLNKSPWNETFLLQAIREHAIKHIWQIAKETKQPIYVIIDDTICEKTVPSSKAQNTIQGCSFHRSHLTGKTVYGHQFVTVMLRCNNVVVPFDIVLYDKNKMSKIEIAQSIIKMLPKPVDRGYILGDSWYTCKKLFKAANDQGYSYLGAFKSNRIIYPRGNRKKGIQIGAFAKTLKMHELNLVTVGGPSRSSLEKANATLDLTNIRSEAQGVSNAISP